MDIEKYLKNKNICEVKNASIFEEAFTHRSFGRKHNERLEFLGDAVLELVVTELLFLDYPDKTEGELTSFRAAIVKTQSLAEESLRLNIGVCIKMSRGEELTGGRVRQYILADVFEALIGAIYLDSGYNAAKEFIEKNLYYKIDDIVTNRLDIDAKSKLQEIAQEKYKSTPYYKVIKEEGPDHDKVFSVIVYIGEKEFESGEGKSKQLAEQVAALKTLSKISDNS